MATTSSKKDRELAFWSNELANKRVTQAQFDLIAASLQTVSSNSSEVWDQAAFGFKPKAKGKCSYKGFEFFDLPRDQRAQKAINGLLVFECFYDKKSMCKVACNIDFGGLYYEIDHQWVLVGYASKGLFTRENPNNYVGKPLDRDKYLATYQCLYDIMLAFRNDDKKVVDRRLDPAIEQALKAAQAPAPAQAQAQAPAPAQAQAPAPAQAQAPEKGKKGKK